MKITIDNLGGDGPIDYTAFLDGSVAPRVERVLNRPSTLRFSLMASSSGFVLPVNGARVCVTKADGSFLFTGYLVEASQFEYLGVGEQGPVYRYNCAAESDEVLLDQKALPNRAPYVAQRAGWVLRQLAQDLLPGEFDTTGVEDLDVIASYAANPQRTFSEHAAELALAARGCYRAVNGALLFAPIGASSYAIKESDADFSPAGLALMQPNIVIDDVTVIGLEEPQAYVRDYFVGDGLTLRFYLSQQPFQLSYLPLIDEEFAGTALDPTTWTVSDPSGAFSIAGQSLQVSGGAGQDGKTTASFIQPIELGGALELQHGDVSFTGASHGLIGGLYAGGIDTSKCLAGFQITPNGSASNIQALINGAATGSVITTTAGHRYLFTTYVYSREVYRSGETYHSAAHPAGQALGGAAVSADVRVVLEVQDINPSLPSSLVAPATVLYDDVMANGADFCTYALVNAVNMECSIAFTYVSHISTAEVRMALPNEDYETQLVESVSEGGQCEIVSSTTLDFYPQYVPPLNALIMASYRGRGRAVAEIVDSARIASLAGGSDDGVRSVVRTMKIPSARTQVDCENAALAMLDDCSRAAWSGRYETWSDFLPGSAEDIFPGDSLTVNVPSRSAAFSAVVRKVSVELLDPANDRGTYDIEFADDLSSPLGHQEDEAVTWVSLQDSPERIPMEQVGDYYLASLTGAQITEVSSTTVQVDAGMAPVTGQAVEVRIHDFGWGASNDRNLLGRFTTQTFTLPRLARTQNYFLRLYDSSAKYSRYSAALHVDYPL